MTKMSKAQRVAILDFHYGVNARGNTMIVKHSSTIDVMVREGWAKRPGGMTKRLVSVYPPSARRTAYVTTAGLIAAGVDMDAIHAEAIVEYALRNADVDLCIAIADERRRLGMSGFRNVDLMALNNVMDHLHAEALTEDRARVVGVMSDKYARMIPDPHPMSNCGPLLFRFAPGMRCPTCGVLPVADASAPALSAEQVDATTQGITVENLHDRA